MQLFHKFITWGLRVAQYVSGASTPIIRSSTTALTVSGFTVEALVVAALLVRLDHDQQRGYHQCSNGETRGC